ncbi:MAG: 23S rRNA (uracil(1939)-C(5))-methyltransferase RlmD [Lachnospiraceae bacterium]|nr:23S rRNA (uracil(1939)-C(5))-methyltransferase RlmD [Lachnospiraceae bacterium]
MTYKKDDLVNVTITDIGNDGEGIGKIDGYTLFIKDSLPGDHVKAKIMKAKKGYAFAHLEEVMIPSPDRVKPRCPIARQCGGCQLQALSYEAQLRYKQDKVKNNLVHIGGFDEDFIKGIMEPIGGMEEPYRYRNKAQYPVGYNKEGKLIAGFFAGRTHSIISCSDCLLGAEDNKEIVNRILTWMRCFGITAYDEEKGKGTVRHILIRKGFATGQIMICLVINSPRLPHKEELVSSLSEIKGVKSISYSINTEKNNVIMGTDYHTVFGEDTIEDRIGRLRFKISPLSFYQVNPVQTENMYGKALEYAALTGNESVWDLYCGIGTISLSMADKAGQIYGVEVVPQAIEDARNNARSNNIENATFFAGKAEEVLPAFYESKEAENKKMRHPDVIIVDPPRKGCDEECLKTMLKMAPERIVYVSCDSATLARDLKYLTAGGYELKAVKPYDNFPQTVHVEVCCLLEQLKSAKEHIEITIDAEDYYRIKDSEKETE